MTGPELVIASLVSRQLIGYLPKPVQDLAIDLFESKASIVMTNVAGPRHPIHFAGVPIRRMMFWVPHPGRQLGMGVSILSYRDSVSLAIVVDARLVPDPERITAHFAREFARMKKLAGPLHKSGKQHTASLPGK